MKVFTALVVIAAAVTGLPPLVRSDTVGVVDLSEREQQYSPSSMIDSIDTELAAYRSASDAARSKYPPITISYGDHDSETVDLFLPEGRRASSSPTLPTLVYIHGGYWQELTKHESAFMVPGLLAEGVAVAVIDYQLAPAATIEHMIQQCASAVRMVLGSAAQYGLDLSAVVVAGSSAGAHLAAMCAVDVDVAGFVLLSGIYDLRPLVGTYINDALDLDIERAERLSPLLQSWRPTAPTVLAVGEIETQEFKRQTTEFAHHLTACGVYVRTLSVGDRNHFDLPFDLGRTSQLFQLTLSLLRQGPIDR